MEEIQLNKPANAHLGFSIAGGISHEHVKGFGFVYLFFFQLKIQMCAFSEIMEYLLQILFQEELLIKMVDYELVIDLCMYNQW